MEKIDKSECEKTKEAIATDDNLLKSGFDSATSVSHHLAECQDCRRWAEQSSKIVSSTRELAQYDVPEVVTQSILRAVAQERKPSFAAIDHVMLLTAAGLAGLSAFVLSESSESVEGLISWSLGLAIIIFIHLTSMRIQTHRVIRQ